MIEKPLRGANSQSSLTQFLAMERQHAQVLRHGIDAGGTEAVGEKHLRRRIQDQFAQLLGRCA